MAINKDYRIRFHYLKAVVLADRTGIKAVVAKIIIDAGLQPEAVNYIFCSDEHVWKINKQYLDHDTYTDIITFDLSESPKAVVADIFISVDRVRENARLAKEPVRREFCRVIFHGALHLTGMRDKSQADKDKMRKQEEKYLGVLAKRSTKHGF